MTLLARFDAFFAAVNDGEDPYPWQRALLATVADSGCWPAAIHAPTGAGKSSVIDIHVFLVAERERARRRTAGRPELRRPPRRLVLVAPRRVLVEDQYERATQLADKLASALRDERDTIVREIARSLQRLLTTREQFDRDRPLGVARLRGGARLDHTWRLDPSQCQIICTTPQMWGSRLLARGFRGSRRSRNLETGLLGHDVVAVIDEAHLHERLVDTGRRAAAMQRAPLALQVVAMSATRPDGGAHRLTEADLADRRLRRRVLAPKRVEVIEIDDWRRDALAAIVAQTQRLAGAGTVGVFVNTVAMAMAVAAALEGTVALVCGRMRPADVERMRSRWPGLLDARGNREVDFLVTTQSLEVGVDLDLPAVVSTIAPASALAQRAGRLNRSGTHDSATFAVVAPSGLSTTDPEEIGPLFAPYAGNEIVAAAGWLSMLDGDASPQQISATELPHPPRAPLPSLTRVELETVAMTGHSHAADVNPSFYVEEPRDRAETLVSIGAREHLDLGEFIVRQALLAAPPRAHELATIDIDRGRTLVAAAPGSWVMRSERARWSAEPVGDSQQILPGDVVVVPARSKVRTAGVIGVTRNRQAEPIDDVISARPDGATPDTIVRLPCEALVSVLERDAMLGGRAARRSLAEVVRAAGERDLAARLARHRQLSDLAISWCADEEHTDGLLIVVAAEREGFLPATVVAATTAPITVEAHGTAVERRMMQILDALDLDALRDLGIEQAQLLAAARWHDEGKRHPKFQRQMGASPEGPALAKPVLGYLADQGDGWRHEQLSAAFAWAHTGGDPVTAVLIAAHHGHGLPLFDRDADAALRGWDGCDPQAAEAARTLFGPSGRYELERTRVQRALGVHHLAYFEALLRCADMQVSREGT